MSEKIPCTYCKKPLDVAELAKRNHRSIDDIPLSDRYCNREHRQLHDIETGHFTNMSHTNPDRRSTAVTRSNREHPRRRKNVQNHD